jgi:hypothetical protein
MNGTQITSTKTLGAVSSNWAVFGTGNLDQSVDTLGSMPGNILWRDSTTGTTALWTMNGVQISQSASIGAVPANWTIQGLNAD